jgi:hypothetical protein
MREREKDRKTERERAEVETRYSDRRARKNAEREKDRGDS